MKKMPSVSVVIPSWNSHVQLRQNLPSVLEAASIVNAEVVIVDDASSQDDSLSYLKSLGDKIRLYENKHNLGFAQTVNRGVREAQGEIIMLLNTDVRPEKNCFIHARNYFSDDSVYALGFNSGEAWMGGAWKDGLFHHFRVGASEDGVKGPRPSLWASGGQAAFSRKKWLALGGMDPLFKPFYWEDTDMGYRAWKRGWQVLWAPDCKVVHDHKKSVIANNFSKAFVMGTAQRNQFLFIWKNISDKAFLQEHFSKLPIYFLKYPLPIVRALFALAQVIKKRREESRYWKRADRDILSLWAK